ncbi:hydrolase [Micromonospora fluostatini]|uniref:Hydrolase n=1 Tax=Micromonospora fluostatini TaxID=1629071 RepID=A0ABY2DLX0_9ACTN|nr:hydrolase [Micromonospora fluostatini]
MMGRSHALSGAVAWLAVCAGWREATDAGLVDTAPGGVVVAAGAAVAAGYALLPDIDHPDSTIARSLGPVTRGLARVTAAGSAALRRIGCAHCERRPDQGGHRALTHTALFAAAAGATVAALASWGGPAAGLPAAGVGAWLAARCALSGRLRYRAVSALLHGVAQPVRYHLAGALPILLALVFVAALALLTPTGTSWGWTGLAAGVGVLTHSLGDALTRAGAPLLWPARIRGCRWRAVGSPRALRIVTGGAGEKVIVAMIGVVGLGFAAILST